MMMVDIQVPALERVFDFELDEALKTGELLDDILALICKKAACRLGKSAEMSLYAVRLERILDRGKTLQCQGVRDGDRFLLI